jgi:hypothetical protein
VAFGYHLSGGGEEPVDSPGPSYASRVCDFLAPVAEILGPDGTSGRVWRTVFWLLMAAIFVGGLYFSITSGAFD